jgi:MFS transporter, ACS family, D-galactonate transporter
MSEPGHAVPTSTKESSAERPTWVRWQIVGLLMAYVLMCHFNRISISVAGTDRIMTQYGIGEKTMGFVYLAYLLAYTLCMTPGGWFIDRFGPKIALALMGFASAVFVVLTGVAGMIFPSAAYAGALLTALLVIRSLTGIVSSPIHPAHARTVSFWIPFQDRAWANGLVCCAACLGIASTYVVFGFLIDWFDRQLMESTISGWSVAFVVSGVATALLAGVWTIYATDRPASHRSVNALERRLIEQSGPSPVNGDDLKSMPLAEPPQHFQTPVAVVSLLRNRSLVLLTLSYAAVGYFEYLFFYWLQHYFKKVVGLDENESRSYATVCTLSMGVGMFVGGWLADRSQDRFGLRRGRAVVPMASMMIGALFLGLGLLTNEVWWVVPCFALAMAAGGACEGPCWNTAVELGGRRGGAAAGIFNTGGNVLGAFSTVITPLVSTSAYFNWQISFGLGCVISVLGALLWLGIDPEERVADGPPAEPSST